MPVKTDMTFIDLMTVLCFLTPSATAIADVHHRHANMLYYLPALLVGTVTGLFFTWSMRKAFALLAARSRPWKPAFVEIKYFFWFMVLFLSSFSWAITGCFTASWIMSTIFHLTS